MKLESSSNNKGNNKLSVAQCLRLFAILFGIISIFSGFEHYEKTERIGFTAAYIVVGVCCLGWAILSYLDERRARIRKEKLEEAQKIAEILSAPLSKYDDEGAAYERALEALEKKYGK